MKNLTILLLMLALSACGPRDAAPPSNDAGPATGTDDDLSSIYAAAVANGARPAADRDRDADRKPAEVLEFFHVLPGMDVLDMFSGGGYYTELLSYVVGDDGHVVAHSNEAYLKFVGDEFEARYLDGRLPNVQVLMAENNELSLEPDSFDAIFLILSFHDLYYAAPDDGWPAFDVPALLAELHKGLRRDGFVAIVDHFAPAGSPPVTGGTTHRIDPAIVVDAMRAAGFELESQSDLLRNPDDALDMIVFDPSVRGKTDRFVMRFTRSD